MPGPYILPGGWIETAVRVRGGNHYLYRAVDRQGQSVGSLLCAGRDRAAAKAFFEQAVTKPGSGWPDKVNVDGHAATHLALRQSSLKRARSQFAAFPGVGLPNIQPLANGPVYWCSPTVRELSHC